MSKPGGSKPSDTDTSRGGFLSRWSTRKAQIARGEDVAEENVDNDAEALAVGHDGASESEEEAALSDAELLEKYELPDPQEVEEEAGLERFFDGKTPERLRQLALRRLWRINPFFGVVDEMVEYGEDYTDAATVIEGMQTAYQAGKGYLKKTLSPEEQAEEQAEKQAQKQAEEQAEEQADAESPQETADNATKPQTEPDADGAPDADDQANMNAAGEKADSDQPLSKSDYDLGNTTEAVQPISTAAHPRQTTPYDEDALEANLKLADETDQHPSVPADTDIAPRRPHRMKFHVKSDG